MVVGAEEVCIDRMEGVLGHKFLAELGAIGKTVGGRILPDLCIEVELGENHLHGTLVNEAVLGLACSRKCALGGEEVLALGYHPVPEVCTALLLRALGADGVFLGGERHIAEEVDSVVVAEEPQGPCLCYVLRFHVEAIDGGGLGLAYELVCETYLEEDTVVGSCHEGVGGGPAKVVYVIEGLVVPAAHGLVSGEALEVEHCTEILAVSSVHAGDVRAAVLSVGRRAGQSLVNLGQELVICLLRVEYITWKLYVRIYRCYVEVSNAGTQAECDSSRTGHKDSVNSFHLLNLLSIKS